MKTGYQGTADQGWHVGTRGKEEEQLEDEGWTTVGQHRR